MKTMSVADAPKFVPFNFNHRYILCAPVTIYLEDGTRQVYYDYLVNTQVGENFNVTVSEDGLSLKLQVKILRAFVDLGARARAEFNVSYANSRVIMSGFCSMVSSIVRTVGPDFDNIWSPGQIDPLPFACRANPGMQIMWHEGDEALMLKLHHDHRINADAKHQMMPILRVTLLSKEVQRMSTVRVEDAVLRHRTSYESGDCTQPPPPGAPFHSTPGPKSNGSFGGGFFPGATGGYSKNNYKSNSNSMKTEPAAFYSDGSTRGANNSSSSKNNSGNDSPRKHKSPHDNNDGGGQGAGDKDDGDGDAKMMGNLFGVNLIEQFFVEADNELKKAADGKQDY
jgi:hypothetical protein